MIIGQLAKAFAVELAAVKITSVVRESGTHRPKWVALLEPKYPRADKRSIWSNYTDFDANNWIIIHNCEEIEKLNGDRLTYHNIPTHTLTNTSQNRTYNTGCFLRLFFHYYVYNVEMN